MTLLEAVRSHILALPNLAKFAVLLIVIVGARPLAKRIRVPTAVLLLFFGVILGPHVLDLLRKDAPVASFLGEIGKLLLMFCAGLEIDLGRLRASARRSGIFGLVTTTTPLVIGTAFALFYHYGTIPAIVIGSLLASHTLLALPIVTRLGILSEEPVIVTIGATVISDTLSLIVFAICASMYVTGFSPGGLVLLMAEIVAFLIVVLVVLGRFGSYLMHRLEGEQDIHFVLMLAIMGIAAFLADLIQLPGIVGAFLAGLAVNRAAQNQPAKERLDFIGSALFIPVFFIVTGLLIDPAVFVKDILNHFGLVAGIIGSLLLGKAIAAFSVGRAFGYSQAAQRTMWAMTLPQVAATLAAAVVAHDTLNHARQPLLDDTTLNAVLVLLVVTSIMGPVLTEIFAPKMKEEAPRTAVPGAAAASGRSPTAR